MQVLRQLRHHIRPEAVVGHPGAGARVGSLGELLHGLDQAPALEFHDVLLPLPKLLVSQGR